MVAAMIFEAIASLPDAERTKPVSVLCTDTRVEIPAIVGMIEGTLEKMRRFAERVHLSKPRFHGVVVVSRQCKRRDQTDDRYHDHQLNQGNALLLFHVRPPKNKSPPGDPMQGQR